MATKIKIRVKKATAKKRVASKTALARAPLPMSVPYPTFEEAIEYLRRFFEHARPQSMDYSVESHTKKLWDVLTALRGPDTPDSYNLKDATTAVIRRKIFGENSQVGRFATTVSDNFDRARRRHTEISKEGHFGRHVEGAFNTLGLLWSESNR